MSGELLALPVDPVISFPRTRRIPTLALRILGPFIVAQPLYRTLLHLVTRLYNTRVRTRVCVYFFILSLKLYKLPKSITRKLLLKFVKIANSCLLTSINYKTSCADCFSYRREVT